LKKLLNLSKMSLYDNLDDVIILKQTHNVKKEIFEATEKVQQVKLEESVSVPTMFENPLHPQQFATTTTKIPLRYIIQQSDMSQDDKFHRLKAGSGAHAESNTIYIGNIR